jgi:hypothetical protein
MRGNSSVVAKLVASRLMLSSMELVGYGGHSVYMPI